MNFSLTRLLAVLNIRNKEFYRDKGALGWVFLFPILIIVSFGYLFNIGEQGAYKVGYFSGLNAPKIEMIQWIHYETKEKALTKLNNQQLDLVVDLEAQPLKFWKAEASPKSSVAAALFENYFSKLKGMNNDDPVMEKIEGRKVKYIDWLFPGLITMNVLWMALWGVGWVVVRQRKIGVLKRFKASPLTPVEYLLAQIVSRLFILVTSGVILFAGSHLIYPFQTLGSYFDILIFYVLGCFALGSIGLIIAARMTSEEFANGLLNLFTYPMMFLSEIWFSLEGSAAWVKSLAWCSPLWHMTYAIRQIMNEGQGMADLYQHALFLVIFSLVFTFVGSFLFRWTGQK